MMEEHIVEETFTSLVLSGRRTINFDSWSEEKLMRELNEANRMVKMLVTENELFENYLNRKDPELLIKLPQVVEVARLAQIIAPMKKSGKSMSFLTPDKSHVSSSFDMSRQGSMGSNSSMSSLTASVGGSRVSGEKKHHHHLRGKKGQKITIAHRMDFTKKEIDRMHKNFLVSQRITLREKDNVNMEYDELQLRIKETEESLEAFKKDVVGIINTEKRFSELFEKFFENQIKILNRQMDKLNLRIVTTKSQILETKNTKAQQKAMGGNLLRPIDFKKLSIENEYLFDETEENHQALKGLKKICGHYNLTLKNHKNYLIERKFKLQSIETDILKEKAKKVKLRRAQMVTSREVMEVQSQLNHLKRLVEEYDYPEVSDFLNVQRQLQEIKKNYKKLWRQRNIQLFTLRPMKQKS